MSINVRGDDVPNYIVLKAKEAGSMNCPKYVYRDGEYGGKLPMASIGGQRVSRFRNAKNIISILLITPTIFFI